MKIKYSYITKDTQVTSRRGILIVKVNEASQEISRCIFFVSCRLDYTYQKKNQFPD